MALNHVRNEFSRLLSAFLLNKHSLAKVKADCIKIFGVSLILPGVTVHTRPVIAQAVTYMYIRAYIRAYIHTVV